MTDTSKIKNGLAGVTLSDTAVSKVSAETNLPLNRAEGVS